jgi:hypothetical protein
MVIILTSKGCDIASPSDLAHQFFKQSTSEPIRRKFDEVIFKEDEAWERSLTPRYYVFSLRGETGDSETRYYR